jgi:YegS/Rv2252/BmrU family lipid kinase
MFQGIQQELERRRVDYSVVFTEYPGHASVLASHALKAGHRVIVSAGGDGTAREIAQELAGSHVPMGILPLGTGNDLGRTLGIPSNPAAALDLLLAGDAVAMDSATVNDRFFLNVSGFGFDVDVLRKTLHYKKRFHGGSAYLLGVLHALFHLRCNKVSLVGDDFSLEEEVLLVAVGNGSYYGGGMTPTPLASPLDGLFDVCVVRKVGMLKVLYCLSKFMKGTHLELDFVRYYKTRSLTIQSGKPIPVQLDGEIIETLPARYELKPASLQVICPLAAEISAKQNPHKAYQ